MNKKQSKRQRDIKSKLMAAICMLLVSSIMMVSTTYAWFTLSTAPEVTGITTAVGANGNLEMALLPTSGSTDDITSAVGDSIAYTSSAKVSNVTWGNLVDLQDNATYGLNLITLYPSQLEATEKDANNNPTKLDAALLSTPTYGADGRIDELLKNAVTSYYGTDSAFTENDDYGVRAIGVASGMTERQLAFRNARNAGNTAKDKAATLAAQSLNTNGSALATIAVKKGTGETAFSQSDVDSLGAILNDLQMENGILDQLETAYIQYILAYAASAATGTTDVAWTSITAAVEEVLAGEHETYTEPTLNNVVSAVNDILTENNAGELPSQLTDAINTYDATVGNVDEAKTAYTTMNKNDEAHVYAWSDISSVVTALADPDEMLVNGIEAGSVMDELQTLIDAVTSGQGIVVKVGTGGGVYADIADQSGDYSASVRLEGIKYGTLTLNANARMETVSTVKPPYLEKIATAVNTAGAPGESDGTAKPITDMYGYIIDLAFRTNAAESNLLLQVDAVDRIYSDQETNEDTMGGGSSMTFQATTTDFNADQVKGLMEAIRIVFFDPDSKNVVATAKLDAQAATLGTDGWTAEMYLYELTAGGDTVYEAATYAADSGKTYYTKTTTTNNVDTYTAVDDATAAAATAGTLYTKAADSETYTAATYAADSGLTYYTKTTTPNSVDTYNAVDDTTAAAAAAGTLYIQKTTTAGENRKTDNVIMALTQNTAAKLSCLVYLDGNKVTNADVAATGSTSMTGTMNLQFASSATLVPMEYRDLHPDSSAETTAPSESTGDSTNESTGA